MKHCPQCKRTYADASLNFCLDDGSKLTFFDTEAETLKNAPRKPGMSADDIEMEIADFLRQNVDRGRSEKLIRFELIVPRGITLEQVSEHFEAGAAKANFNVVDKTDTRATVRRKPPEVTFRHVPSID
jgi:hypothetical protein